MIRIALILLYPFRHYITVVGKIAHATKSHLQNVTRCITIFVPIRVKGPLNALSLVRLQLLLLLLLQL